MLNNEFNLLIINFFVFFPRQARKTEGGLHYHSNMCGFPIPGGDGDIMLVVSPKATSTSSRLAPSPAATRPFWVFEEDPAARVRGIGRTLCQRGQCLMVASTPEIVSWFSTPPAIY